MGPWKSPSSAAAASAWAARGSAPGSVGRTCPARTRRRCNGAAGWSVWGTPDTFQTKMEGEMREFLHPGSAETLVKQLALTVFSLDTQRRPDYEAGSIEQQKTQAISKTCLFPQRLAEATFVGTSKKGCVKQVSQTLQLQGSEPFDKASEPTEISFYTIINSKLRNDMKLIGSIVLPNHLRNSFTPSQYI